MRQCNCMNAELCMRLLVVFFFKQKTAYEMRISDWSSDVCSSDLDLGGLVRHMDHGRSAALHEERRFLDHVMAEVDDAVRRLDRAVDEIARRQQIGRASCRERVCQYV